MHSAMSTPKRIVSRMSNGNPPDDFAGLVCTAGGFSSTVDDAFSDTSLTPSPPPLRGPAVLDGSLRKLRSRLRRLRSTGALRGLGAVLSADGSLRKLRSHHYLATFHHHVQNG